MKKLENAATNETNIAAEENELRKEVKRLWKMIENDQACSAFLLKQSRKMEDIFAEMRILIAAKQTEKFVTTYKSYKEEYDRLRKQFKFDHPRSMKMSVIERQIQLTATKTNIFNLWKMIETSKLIVQGIDEITRQRREKVREIIIQESISKLNWTLLRREEVSKVQELCLNFGVRYTTLNLSNNNNVTPPISKKRKLEDNPETGTNTGDKISSLVSGMDEKEKLVTSGFSSAEQKVAVVSGSPVVVITNEQLLQFLFSCKQMPQQPLLLTLPAVLKDNADKNLILGTKFF
ncbi:hypothetical protein CAEBREN_10073 [Caenorhabditis brenneri]|uniref:Uncharacterized protein n=1 Tax=Caenorhabditis brenneri TaxID=135651 RepID=G0M792_CAEBE|nr:hypothetical protein CAEBREN_10073 [Caenorhabditis brenneri]